MTEIDRQPDVLVVDDIPTNLTLLAEMLRSCGYRARLVRTGTLALRAARARKPDLVLLDIHMPGMDGYQVCEELKADVTLADVPIIFISALHETDDKVKAFERGGVDYITRPFQFEEVRARIETHLELRRKESELRDSYDQLKSLEQLRDGLVHMIAHDMRSPLTVTNNFLELACWQGLSEPVESFVTQAMTATRVVIEMVNSLLDVSKMESGKMELDLARHDMGDLARQAMHDVENLSGHRKISMQVTSEPVFLVCDGILISRVLQNLLSNAIRFTDEQDGELRILVDPGHEAVRVSIRDNGPGIPAEYHDRVFEKFAQLELRQKRQIHSVGLGLTFCKLAVESHGGSIRVDSEEGEGSTFRFELPTRPLKTRDLGDTSPVKESGKP